MCLQQLEVLKQTLCKLGFTVNVEKSQQVPVNEILYLGFIINSIAMRLRLPAVKLEKIVTACKALLAKHQPSVFLFYNTLFQNNIQIHSY